MEATKCIIGNISLTRTPMTKPMKSDRESPLRWQEDCLKGLGFGVWGLGFRVWGSGFRVWGLGFGV